jgi:MFS family permease
VKRVVALGRQTFAALAIPNYRRYFAGQAISLVGTWMQSIAQSWLVLQLTGSATALGFVVGLQMLPVLVLGPYGGVVADRIDKRRLMIALQSVMGVLALDIGLLTVTGAVRLWQVYLFALLLGLINAFENPARQTFVLEMVGPRDLRNAVTLNSVLVNAARAVGAAVAGILIATVGIGVCFLLNAVSFVAVVYSLLSMDTGALSPTPPAVRAKGQLRAGLRYVRRTPALRVPLLMMALIGTLAYEFQVVLPVVAREAFHGNASTYGLMTSAMGVGAVVGGLVTASRRRTGLRPLTVGAATFGLLILAAAAAPNLTLEVAALTLVGAASVSFLAVGNSTLQLTALPTMRGRVMALWAVAFLGSTPVGGPIAGWVSEYGGGRAGLVLGGIACLLAALLGLLAGDARRVGIDPAGALQGESEPPAGRARASLMTPVREPATRTPQVAGWAAGAIQERAPPRPPLADERCSTTLEVGHPHRRRRKNTLTRRVASHRLDPQVRARRAVRVLAKRSDGG